jgi:hypothetical protein
MEMIVSVRMSVSPFIAFYDMQERGQCVYSFFPKEPRSHTEFNTKQTDKRFVQVRHRTPLLMKNRR